MSSIAAKRKLLVSDVMTSEPVTLPSGASAHEAARLMKEHNIGAIVVVDDNLVAGIVTDRDIVTRVVAPGGSADDLTLAEIATRNPICAHAEQHASEAVSKMREHAVSRLPVVEHGRVIGMLSVGDIALKMEDRTTMAAVFSGQHADD